jgi:hypothetical protein
VPRFALQFPPDLIPALAARFPSTDDAGAAAAGRAARERGHYARAEFLLVCEWKTARSRPKVAVNSAAAIRKATRTALTDEDESVRMAALTSLEGVGVPTASTLLHFASPGDYPLLDVRALESLGAKSRSVYPISFWLEYLDACRRLAREAGVSLRTLDKALWQYSKERA